ncbi:MAG TPA: ribosome small subunit-dependent GTPase A [Kiritimatiellia bacterium]|nr:ribosome small subunit-dependent GTPase A [Kiritimatiellia bacterium]HMO98913.1 ribosome small subunit-dependent GTPase A [Kiritimatiellia bacterium]
MKLTDLGFDGWFEQHCASLLQPGQRVARVTAVDRGAFLVRHQDAETPAELTGKFRFAIESAIDLPCVGDWVCVQCHGSGSPAIIHHVFPRKTFLRRKCPGKTVDFQMIAANIDVAFIVQSCGYDFNLARLDRYLVMAHEGAIEPWILLTKTDLVSPDAVDDVVGQVKRRCAFARVVALSNTTGVGLDALRALLVAGRTYCLLGSSGVGKTTLINRLIGRDTFDTKAVSGTGEGVHTTSRRQLLLLGGGSMLIDTPGMRELGLLGAGDGVDDTFADIQEYAVSCRFADCTHTNEPGCAVLLAAENGMLSEDRYQNYLKLKKESAFHDLSYVEKRMKDKSFGRFIKSAKKSLRK